MAVAGFELPAKLAYVQRTDLEHVRTYTTKWTSPSPQNRVMAAASASTATCRAVVRHARVTSKQTSHTCNMYKLAQSTSQTQAQVVVESTPATSLSLPRCLSFSHTHTRHTYTRHSLVLSLVRCGLQCTPQHPLAMQCAASMCAHCGPHTHADVTHNKLQAALVCTRTHIRAWMSNVAPTRGVSAMSLMAPVSVRVHVHVCE